jgi:DNA-binding Lrp family transcriptional regulator
MSNYYIIKMYTLTTSEKKILHILEQDARYSYKTIAAEVRLTPEGVKQIMKRLLKKGIIKYYNTKVNYARLGYSIYPMHFRLNKPSTETKKNIESLIKKSKSIAWHSFCEGEYDLMVSFKIRSHEEKEDMELFIKKVADYVEYKDLSYVQYSWEIGASFTGGKQAIFQTIKQYKPSEKEADLDNLDMQILQRLRLNARESTVRLAGTLHTTARIIAYRIRNLKKNGVITGFKTKINWQLLGYHPGIALIKLNTCTQKEERKLEEYLRTRGDFHYFVKQIGTYDIKCNFHAQSIENFYKTIEEIRDSFPFVRRIATLISE